MAVSTIICLLTCGVLGAQSRQFKTVFGEAQTQLRVTFGMEMTELPLKDKVTLAQRRGWYLGSNAPSDAHMLQRHKNHRIRKRAAALGY